MKPKSLLGTFLLCALILTGCSNASTVSLEHIDTLKKVELENQKIAISIPENFTSEVDSANGGYYVFEEPRQVEFTSFSLHISEPRDSGFSSFEDFANDMEKNYIKKVIVESFGEDYLETGLAQFENHYSFSREKIGDLDVLLHRRDFAGWIGDIYTMYVFVDGKIVEFHSESDNEKLDEIYRSIEPI